MLEKLLTPKLAQFTGLQIGADAEIEVNKSGFF
jgi:hypothetical protein